MRLSLELLKSLSPSEPKGNDGKDPLFSLKEHIVPEEDNKDQPIVYVPDDFTPIHTIMCYKIANHSYSAFFSRS